MAHCGPYSFSGPSRCSWSESRYAISADRTDGRFLPWSLAAVVSGFSLQRQLAPKGSSSHLNRLMFDGLIWICGWGWLPDRLAGGRWLSSVAFVCAAVRCGAGRGDCS